MKGTELPQGRGPVRVSGTRTTRIAVTYTARSWAHAARRGLCVQDADAHPTGDRQGLTLNCFTGSSFDVAGRPNASWHSSRSCFTQAFSPQRRGARGAPRTAFPMLHLTPRAHTSNGASGFQNIRACLQDPRGHTLRGEAATELPGAPSPTHWGGRAPHWPLHPFLPLGRGWEPIWAPAEQLVTLSRNKRRKETLTNQNLGQRQWFVRSLAGPNICL